MDNAYATAGAKQQASAGLRSLYDAQYVQAKGKESIGLGNVYKNYYSQLGAENERLMNEGAKYSALESKVYDYVKNSGDKLFGDFASITPETALERNMYDVKNGGYELTDVGREFFRRALNQEMGATSFTNYLRQNDAELLDWYVQNKDNVRNLVGGLKETDTGLSDKEYAEWMEAKSRNKNIITESELKKQRKHTHDDWYQIRNYYNTDVHYDPDTARYNKPFDIFNWEFALTNAHKDADVLQEEMNIPKEITKGLRKGDYFTYNGEYYQFEGDNKYVRFITDKEFNDKWRFELQKRGRGA